MRGEGPTDTTHVFVAGPGARATNADVTHTGNVLGVTYRAQAEDWLSDFQAGTDRLAVVSVGERSRAAAAAGSTDAGADVGADLMASSTGAVETVTDTADVAAVGTLVNDYLSAWEGAGPTTIYVDDVATVLDHVAPETAFRFLHALVSRADAMDATVVVGFDTGAHPPHVAATFEQLFDDVREGA
jgi:hypothetical protein